MCRGNFCSIQHRSDSIWNTVHSFEHYILETKGRDKRSEDIQPGEKWESRLKYCRQVIRLFVKGLESKPMDEPQREKEFLNTEH